MDACIIPLEEIDVDVPVVNSDVVDGRCGIRHSCKPEHAHRCINIRLVQRAVKGSGEPRLGEDSIPVEYSPARCILTPAGSCRKRGNPTGVFSCHGSRGNDSGLSEFLKVRSFVFLFT